MQSACVANLVDETRKPDNDVGQRLIVTEISLRTLRRLHKALGLAIIVGIAAPAHRTGQLIFG